MDLRLQDKRAPVTGVSEGIGRATAMSLGEQGGSLMPVARTLGTMFTLDGAASAG